MSSGDLPPISANTTIGYARSGNIAISRQFQEWLERARLYINSEISVTVPVVGLPMAAYPATINAATVSMGVGQYASPANVAVFASYGAEAVELITATYDVESANVPEASYGAAIEIPIYAEY